MHKADGRVCRKGAVPPAIQAVSCASAKGKGVQGAQVRLGCEEENFVCGDLLLDGGFPDGYEFSFSSLTEEEWGAVEEIVEDAALLKAIEACSDSVEHLVNLFELLSSVPAFLCEGEGDLGKTRADDSVSFLFADG